MKDNRKELKVFSIMILIFTGTSILRSILDVCINGFPKIAATDIPENVTPEMLHIASVVTFVIGLILFIPQIYIGVKGILVANGSSSGKAHIVWAVILAICSGIAMISAISTLLGSFSVDSLVDVLGIVVDFALYVFYFIFARKVNNEN
jgi:hypothetical protein